MHLLINRQTSSYIVTCVTISARYSATRNCKVSEQIPEKAFAQSSYELQLTSSLASWVIYHVTGILSIRTVRLYMQSNDSR